MIIVFPMAGRAKRFFDEGYIIPKYMIEINNKSLFEYSLESIPYDIAEKIVFIALQEHETKYSVTNFIHQKMLKLNIFNFEVILIPEVTRGQAETVLKAEKYIKENQDLVIYNIDTYFKSSSLRKLLIAKTQKQDGIISAFYIENPNDKWSYAKIDDNYTVLETAEKIPISNYALTGMYHFSKGQDFINVAKEHIGKNILNANEFYIAPMYNDLIKQGKKFVLDIAEEFLALGTPDDIKNLLNK
ncbi:MAG: glycosyltransferase family 2 protein [Candidatus Gastranaerophilaceae bacterium]|jgi:dTDP-glucose pyrophosphorylase